MQLPEKALARMVDSSTRCMTCNKLGHALCEPDRPVRKKSRLVTPYRTVKLAMLSPLLGISTHHSSWLHRFLKTDNHHLDQPVINRVYCPNCGEDGHHVDYSPGDANRAGSILGSFNACKVPRYDAYIKFPQLLRGLDRQGSSSSERAGRQEYYQSLVWSGGSGEQVQNMFPSLCRMKFVGGIDQDKRRHTMSAGEFPSRGRSSIQNGDDAPSDVHSGIGEGSSRRRRDSDRRNSNVTSSSRHGIEREQVSRSSQVTGSRKVQSRGDEDFSDHHESHRNNSHRTVFQEKDKLQRRTSSSSNDMGRDGSRKARRY